MPQLRKQAVAVLLCALGICLATTTCLASDWWSGVDEHPRKVASDAWLFSIKVPVIPAGQLIFVGSQYDFAEFTPWMGVDYRYNKRNHGSMDFSDDRGFQAIAPTLFDPIDGFVHGWDITDLKDGVFSGIVYSQVPPTTVYFIIAADQLLPR